MKQLLTLLILSIMTSGCGDNKTKTFDMKTQNSNSKEISRKDFREDWPFSVESGTLKCVGNKEVVFITNGKTYAVNGTAQSDKNRLDAGDICEVDPQFNDPRVKKSIGPIIEAGLKLCK